MNILLVNHYAGAPEYGMEYRPYYFGREWVRQGHRVTVVGAAQSHLRFRAPQVSRAWGEEQIEGIRYVWLPGPRYSGNGFGRVKNILSFVRKLEFANLNQFFNGDRPDVVIASSTYTLDIFPCRRIARSRGAKLIYEVHDLWPLSPMELGDMSPWHPFIMVVQWAENYACRHADLVVSLLPKAEPHFRQHGMTAGKFAYVPNGIDVEEWRSCQSPIPPEQGAALRALKASGSFLVGYAGAHGVANALHAVLEAANLLRDWPVTFVLVGKGPQKELLRGKAKEHRLSNVVFLPPVPKSSIPSLLSCFDALYIGLQRKPIFRFGVSPNKLMDYMMSAKPVLQAIEAGNDLVGESRCGISLAAEDPQALAAATLRLMNWTPVQRAAAGMGGRRYILEHHDYRSLAGKFAELMSSLCRAPGTSCGPNMPRNEAITGLAASS